MTDVIILPKRRMERRNTAAALALLNEVLLDGEWCLETDTRKVKFGDGVTAYNSLLYVGELANLGNPIGDRLVYWDDTVGRFAFLSLGTGLTIGSGGDLDVTAPDPGNQNANYVWAGPVTGSPGAVTFRALVNADIPSALTGKTYNGLGLAHNGAGTFTIEEPFALHILTVVDSATIGPGVFVGNNSGDQVASGVPITDAGGYFASADVEGALQELGLGFSSFPTKPEVAYATATALPSCTYSNGASGVGATLTGTANGPLLIDGVTLAIGAAGQRVLVGNESSGFRNGWYTITQVGVIAVSPFILTRSTGSDQAAEIGPGYITPVEAPNALTPGTNNGKVFISIAPVPFVVGTDTVLFSAVGSTASTPTGTGFRHVTSGTEDGATKLVDTADINNDQVTYAKIQNASANTVIARAANSSGDLSEVALSASQLLGRGASGDVAAITLGTGLSMTGAVLSGSGSYTPIATGTSNPGSPATYDLLFRTDLGLLIYYDGTQWLTLNEWSRQMYLGLTAQSANFNFGYPGIPSDYGLWLKQFESTTLVSGTNNGSNYWTVSIYRESAGGTDTLITSFTTAGDTAGQWTQHNTAINAVLNSTARILYVNGAKTGSPGTILVPGAFTFRKIIT